MGQNCSEFLPMCLESVKDADKIIFCDGGSVDNTIEIAKQYNTKIIKNKFIQEDKDMISKQRNFYLDYLKKNYKDYWCLVIDADEVVEDFSLFKNLVNKHKWDDTAMFSPRMRHFIKDLGHEDATQQVHNVHNRFFKITDDKFYPIAEHTILSSTKETKTYPLNNAVIWHLGHLTLWNVIRRYDGQRIRRGEGSHDLEFLNLWYRQHLFGKYPVKEINLLEIPDVILNHFGVIKDEIYFANHCNLNIGHFMSIKAWQEYFKPKNILDLGCGVGLYGYVARYVGIPYLGMDISKWIVKNNIYNLNLQYGDITKKQKFKDYDLVLVADILEHLEEKDLDKTLKHIKEYGKNFLFSIPYKGDPNLYQDPTHKIFQEKEWWMEQLSKHFSIQDVPKDWIFSHQFLIGRKR